MFMTGPQENAGLLTQPLIPAGCCKRSLIGEAHFTSKKANPLSLTDKYQRISGLVGGIVLVVIGLLLIFKSEMLAFQ